MNKNNEAMKIIFVCRLISIHLKPFDGSSNATLFVARPREKAAMQSEKNFTSNGTTIGTKAAPIDIKEKA